MCCEIEADVIMANYFLKNQQPLTFGHLRRIRTDLEARMGESVYVDVSRPALLSAVEMHPEMFRWDGNTITRSDNADRFFQLEYIEDYFNTRLHGRLGDEALNALRAI